jgi:pyruvate formate lyase activating enzyme
VRFERDGELRAPFGYVARTHVRPVETNTIYHVLPGTLALTFGMYGCDLRCPYCHNARISQALREGASNEQPEDTTARALVERAVAADCRVLCAAYNEPALAAEWLHDVFAEAKAHGLVTAMITDGHATTDVLRYLRPVTDVYRVDLKASREADYQALGGRLSPVLAAIRTAKELGYWVEVVTLIVPSFNDDLGGIRSLATTLAGIDTSMPWHLNAFQPRYRMRDRPATSAGTLISAVGTAYARGMTFVYAGNVDDTTTELAATRCPSCHDVLIERRDWKATSVTGDPSCCARCGTAIPGVWTQGSRAQRPPMER